METYYWEYWEGDDVYSGTIDAQDEHLAYQQIKQIIKNDVATIQSNEVVGAWAFTEAETVNPQAQSRQFTEDDMNEILERSSDSDETIEIDRDETKEIK